MLSLAKGTGGITSPRGPETYASGQNKTRTTDYGLSLKHRLRYKMRAADCGLGVIYGLGYKMRTKQTKCV